MKAVLDVNGERHELDLRGAERLLDVLRHRLGLTGAKAACRQGECGTCTVLVDRRPVLACVTPAAVARGAVTTVEGVAEEAEPLRRAFADEGGFQCGFCTPGQIMRALALLAESSAEALADGAAVRAALAGNVCRVHRIRRHRPGAAALRPESEAGANGCPVRATP
ncbi:(2Fe-2S)-binding protein [Streptomyces sp. NPDC058424]|uniref:(2Fe-2S)-binding protein n=1 Tax=Streptomyces sp. NPDC058424 TaxID=3346491 RepID=UPI0036669D61